MVRAKQGDVLLVGGLMLVALVAESLSIRYFTSALALDNSKGLLAGVLTASVAGLAISWMASVIWRRL
jgi:hypothetical protein